MDERRGHLGTSYGYQLAKKIRFEANSDQVDRVLYLLKNDPMNRRIQTNMLNLEEMKDMTLAPCAYETPGQSEGSTRYDISSEKSRYTGRKCYKCFSTFCIVIHGSSGDRVQ